MEAISKHIKDKKVTGSSQHRFRKRKSCLTFLTAFYDKIISLVDKQQILFILTLEGLLTLSHNVLIQKLINMGKINGQGSGLTTD